MNETPKKASDPCDLERKIIDPNIAKSETEWWARERILELEYELEQAKENYGRVCRTIAEIHAAAVGEITGPKRGVVEDVEDLRLERDALRQQLAEYEKHFEAVAIEFGSTHEGELK